jgi:hypothetical protein
VSEGRDGTRADQANKNSLVRNSASTFFLRLELRNPVDLGARQVRVVSRNPGFG